MSDKSDVILDERSMELRGNELRLVTSDGHEQTTVRFDTERGNLALGGDYVNGDLVVRNGESHSLIHLDAGDDPADPEHVNVYLDGETGDAALTGDLRLNSWGAPQQGQTALSADHRFVPTAPAVDLDVGLDQQEVQDALREARTYGRSRRELEKSISSVVDRHEPGKFEPDGGATVSFETTLNVGEEFDAVRLENPEVRDEDDGWVSLDEYVDRRVDAALAERGFDA